MAKLPIYMVIKDYDHIAPLAAGDVIPEGIELRLERDTPGSLDRTLADQSIDVGEMSMSRHILRMAANDHSFVAFPVFPTRAFRHRCFFVRRDSGLKGFKGLEGKRMGTNEWPATGNTWSRAAMREQGVRIESISWLVGSIDGAPSNRPQGVLPTNVRLAEPGRALRDMLIAGELDALMCPNPPRGFYDPDSPIVRLYPDFPKVEAEYFQRTGIYPAHHIVGVRKHVYDKNPWVLRSLFEAMEESKQRWMAQRRLLPETTPWMLADVEQATAVMGFDWQPNGLTEGNLRMVQALCDEQLAQGLLDKPMRAEDAFTEFAAVMKS